MRLAICVVLATVALSGCVGPEGNPNGFPYATDPGGTIAVKPGTAGVVAYDPYAMPAPFADMQVGQPAINPPPQAPLNLPPAATPPRR